MRRLMIRAGALLTLLLVSCAPTAPAPSGGQAPATTQESRTAEQKLTVAVKGVFGNPTPQSSATLAYMFWPMFDNLTKLDRNYQVQPSIAEKWELQGDGKTWRFSIRKDVSWPDGSKLTAHDVAFTMNTVIQRKWPQQPYFEPVSEAKVVDDYTVDFLAKVPDMSIPAGGNFLWIVPKVYYEQVGFDAFVQKPVGSGPYELLSFRNADSVKYKKRATAHAFRRPIADELTFQVVAENSQIINGLRTGDIDLLADVSFTGDQADQLKKQGINLVNALSTLSYLALPQGLAELRNTPFKDKKVRQALWYAINREALTSSLFKGYARPAIAVSVPGTLYDDPSIQIPKYDPALSKKLLAEAGYPNGFRLPTGLGYNTVFGSQDIIVALQADLKAIGLDFDVVANERAVAVDKAYGRNNLQKEDIWIGRQGDPIGFGGSRTFIGCGKPVGDKSALYWCSEEWDRLMDQAYAEKDIQKRGEILKKANRLEVEEAVYQAIYLEPLFTGSNEKVRGLQIDNPLYFNFDSVYKVN